MSKTIFCFLDLFSVHLHLIPISLISKRERLSLMYTKIFNVFYVNIYFSILSYSANGLNHVFWCLEIAPVNICRFWVCDEAPRKKEMRQKGMNLLDFVFEGYQLPTS